MIMKKLTIYFSFLFLWLLSTPAIGMLTTYTFSHIVQDGDTAQQLADGIIGQTQLFVDVDEFSSSQVLFTFRNIGPQPSSITDVYFEQGSLESLASIDDSDSGVSFSQFASPSNLPGGNNLSPPFIAVAGFAANSNPPIQPNGVNPGESLGVVFDIQEGKNFDDVINELNNKDLRVGIHVQGFAGGGSEAFINNGPTIIPLPGAILLCTVGIGFVGWLHTKRKL
jgi:hypothetical protein